MIDSSGHRPGCTPLAPNGEVQTNVTHSAPVDNGTPFFTVPDS
jgi:hypothetical protein